MPEEPREADSRRGSAVGAESDGLEDRRRRLEAALASRNGAARPADDRGGSGKSSYARAFQLSTEFIAAVLVGAGLGYLFDRFLGTAPWGMIVFLLLGFAAGVLNVMRSAGLVAESRWGKAPGDRDGKL